MYTNFIVNGISIISNKPQVSFINSKDFFESYYGNRDSVILDLRNYKNYRELHIENAVNFEVNSVFENYLGIPRKIKRVNELIYTFSNAGVGGYNTVGIYGEKLEDTFVIASLLHILGVERVFIIKDGFEGWKSNSLPVSKKIKLVGKGYFPYRITKSFYELIILDLDKVKDNINDYFLVATSYNSFPLISGSVFVKPKFDFNRYVIGSYYNSYEISRDKMILLYGVDNYEVLQVYFALKVFLGYLSVSIFNGGINEWTVNGLPAN
ncbi:MAG: rhodanese-like domain-containing protein [bacterium]